MPTPKRGPRLGGGPAHQKLMLANLASDLFRHGRIKTTESKAKTLRPYAEKLITRAKAGDLAARRQVQSKLRDRDVTTYLFEEVAPRFADRPGGYTRILKLGPRPGDNAPMAIIELVDLGAGPGTGDEAIEEGKQQRSRGLFGRRRRTKAEPAAAAPAADASLDVEEDVDESVSEESVSEESESDEDVAAADAPATGPEEPGPEAKAPPQDPEDEPDAPDDPAVGDPVDLADDDAAGDAGATGKDAGA